MSEPQLCEVVLHGELGRRFGERRKLAVRSVAEIGIAMDVLRPGYARHLIHAHEEGVAYKVFVDGVQIDKGQLSESLMGACVEIVPTAIGKGSAGRIIIGILLILVSFVPGVGSVTLGLGISLLVGGIVALIAENDAASSDDVEEGFAFSGSVNTTRAGVPIPLLLGEALAGSAVASFGINAPLAPPVEEIPRTGYYSGAPGYTPVYEPWGALQTDQVARVLDLVSDGEIFGFISDNPADDIYLDEQPLLNFSGSSFEFRPGTNDQASMDDYMASEATTNVGKQLITGELNTRTTTAGSTPTRIRVNFKVFSLSRTSKAGKVKSASVAYSIRVKPTVGQSTSQNRSVAGLVQGVRTITEELQCRGTGPWDIEVTLLSPGTQERRTQDILWDSFVELAEERFSFPNLAMLGITFRASDHRSIPARRYRMRGILCRVPTNYDTETRLYSGDWDGQFKLDKEWTDNNAWVALELVTNPLYGMGTHISDAYVDVWAFYKLAGRCDDPVDDLKGENEPRYTYGEHLQRSGNAWAIVQRILAHAHSKPFWTGSRVSVTVDQYEDPIYEFNPTNVVDGIFSYSGAPVASLFNRILVRFKNPEMFDDPDVVTVDDDTSIGRFGLLPNETALDGCRSIGMATRHAYWEMETQRLGDGVRFRSGAEVVPLMPGRVIRIVDPRKGAAVMAGRLVEGAGSLLQLDEYVELEAGKSYTADVLMDEVVELITAAGNVNSLVLPARLRVAADDYRLIRVAQDDDQDGEYEILREPNAFDWDAGPEVGTIGLAPHAGPGTDRVYRVEFPLAIHTAAVTTGAGVTRELLIDSDLPIIPPDLAAWVLYEQGVEPGVYRVVAVEQVGPAEYELAGIPEDPDKYTRIATGALPPDEANVELPLELRGLVPPPPVGVVASLEIEARDTGTTPVLNVSWSAPPDTEPGYNYIAGYRVAWSDLQGFSGESRLIADTHYSIPLDSLGLYEVRVQSEQVFTGRLSPAVRVVVDASESQLPPITIGLRDLGPAGRMDLQWVGTELKLSWTPTLGSHEISENDEDILAFESLFDSWVIDIFDGIDGHRVFGPHAGFRDAAFTFSPDDELLCGANGRSCHNGAPHRDLLVRVSARDVLGRLSDADEVRLRNVAPAIPTLLSIQGIGGAIVAELLGPTNIQDPGFVGYMFWSSTTPGFTPKNGQGGNLVYKAAADSVIRFPVEGGETYYVRFAGYDRFSDDPADLQVSEEVPVVVSLIVDPQLVVDSAIIGDLQIDDLQANKIIGPGVLDMDVVAVGTLRAEHIAFGSRDNLIFDPIFAYAQAPSNLGQVALIASGTGVWSVELSTTYVGDKAAKYTYGGDESVPSSLAFNRSTVVDLNGHFSVFPEDQVYFEVFALSTTVTERVRAVVEFREADGTLVSRDLGPLFAKNGQGWVRVFHSAEVPTVGAAAYAVCYVECVTGEAAGKVVVIDRAYARRMIHSAIIESGATANSVLWSVPGIVEWPNPSVDLFETTGREVYAMPLMDFTPLATGIINVRGSLLYGIRRTTTPGTGGQEIVAPEWMLVDPTREMHFQDFFENPHHYTQGFWPLPYDYYHFHQFDASYIFRAVLELPIRDMDFNWETMPADDWAQIIVDFTFWHEIGSTISTRLLLHAQNFLKPNDLAVTKDVYVTMREFL